MPAPTVGAARVHVHRAENIMTEKSDSASAWGEEWIESQRNYWTAWSGLYQQALDSGSHGNTRAAPWAEGLDHWWKAVSPGAPEPTQDFLRSIIQQGKGYLRMGEEFTRLVQGAATTSGAGWQDLLQPKIDELKAAFSPGRASEMMGAMGGMLPFFALPLDTWARMVSSASVLPGDFLQGLKPDGVAEGVADRLHDQIGRFLSVPGVGYTREWQEQTQKMGRLALDYERALQEYYSAHGRLGVDSLERLLKKIMERMETGEDIKTLREVYDLWVDCGEEAYNSFVFTQEYAEIYGRLVNALMALKHHSQHLIDEMAAAMNLPTHKGLTTLQHRQQELRRQLMVLRTALEQANGVRSRLKALQDEVSGADLKAMKSEIKAVAGLARELAELRAELLALKDVSAGAAEPMANGGRPTAKTGPAAAPRRMSATKSARTHKITKDR